MNVSKMNSFKSQVGRLNHTAQLGIIMSCFHRSGSLACPDREVAFHLSALAERQNNLSALAER
jgi:hypothetical protein